MVAPPYFDVPPTAYGGIETVVADLVDSLVARGHQVTLIGAGRHATRAQRFITTYDVGPADRLGEPMPEIVHAAKVAGILDTLDVDVIHDHTMAGPLMARGRLTPTVVTAHGPVTVTSATTTSALGDTDPTGRDLRRAAGDMPRPALGGDGAQRDQGGDVPVPRRRRRSTRSSSAGSIRRSRRTWPSTRPGRPGLPIVLAGKCSEPIERAYFAREVEPRIGKDVTIFGVADAAAKRRLLSRAACMLFPIPGRSRSAWS